MSEEFLANDLNVVTSCFLGSKFEKPKVLSSLNETFVPETSTVFKLDKELKVNYTSGGSYIIDFNSLKDIPTFNSLELIYVAFEFPALIANCGTAMAGYCDLPALYIFKNIKISFGNQVTESLNPLTLNLALQEHFKDKYSYVANKWLGGENGPNQEISTCEMFRRNVDETNVDCKQNVIKERLKCLLPLPFHIFRNKNFKNKMCTQNIVISFLLNQFQSVINHNAPFVIPQDMNDSMFSFDFYCQSIASNEFVFNNLPHITPIFNEAYIESDEVFNMNIENKVIATADLKLTLNQWPTTRYLAQITPAHFVKKALYCGETNEKAVKNYWAAMFKIKPPDTDSDGLLQLNSLTFTKKNNKDTNLSSHGEYKVKLHSAKSFLIIYYSSNRQETFETLISFSIEMNLFPDHFYMDLFHHKCPPAIFFLKPEFFSRINFEFEEFDPYNILHNEDLALFQGEGITNVRNFYFSIKAKDTKKYVFKEVNSIQKSLFVNENLIRVAASTPVHFTEQSFPHSLIA